MPFSWANVLVGVYAVRKIKGLDISIIVLAFALTFTLLVAASNLNYMVKVDRPLRGFLEANPHVADYKISETGGKIDISVKLKEGEDLGAAYRDLMDGLQAISGGRSVELSIADNRDALLMNVYHEMHFAIEEAIMQGDFTMMNARLTATAERHGIQKFGVSVDRDNVYVQLEKDGHHLYQVVPRYSYLAPARQSGPPVGASPGQKGGSSLW